MAGLLKIVNPNAVISDLRSRSSSEVLRELAQVANRVDASVDVEEILTELAAREKECPTAIGKGIAIPHARLRKLQKSLLLVARSKEGVDFSAEDRLPVRLFFVLLAGAKDSYLKLLAEVSRHCQDTKFVEDLLEFQSAQEMYAYLETTL